MSTPATSPSIPATGNKLDTKSLLIVGAIVVVAAFVGFKYGCSVTAQKSALPVPTT